MEFDLNDLVAALDQNRKVNAEGDIGDDFVLVRQADGAVKVLDLIAPMAQHQANPRRAAGTVALRNEQSFVDYVNDHKDPLTTAIFAEDRRVTAIFNHHERWVTPRPETEDGVPVDDSGILHAGWGDYRAVLELKYSPAWTAWTGLASAGWMTHTDFAEFLEMQEGDVLEPDTATLRELVLNMKLASASKMESMTNVRNGGVRLVFEEKFEPVGAGEGDYGVIEFPHHLQLRLVVFDGGSEVEVPAVLRYRVDRNAGQLQFRVAFSDEINRIFDDAFDEMCGAISAGTNLKVHRGSA